MAENSPASINVMTKAPEKDLVQWDLYMNTQGLPVGWDMIIPKSYDINHYMIGSMRSVGLVGRLWCGQLMS